MKKLQDMSPDELYELGHHIGSVAKTRPDATHRLLVGLRDALDTKPEPVRTGFGDILWTLWRRWHHHIADTETPPPVPLDMGARPSGVGLGPWSFDKTK